MKHGSGYSILIIVCAMLVVSSSVGIFFDTNGVISNIVSTATTIVGAVAIWIQFKKDKEISMAGFIIELNKVFYERDNGDLLNFLDEHGLGENPAPIPDNLKKNILPWIRWARDIANLVNRKVVSFPGIDSPLGYKFFLILNNPQVQEMEICKYADFYHPLFEAHKAWRAYRIKAGEPLVNEKFDLSKTKEYQNYFAKKK